MVYSFDLAVIDLVAVGFSLCVSRFDLGKEIYVIMEVLWVVTVFSTAGVSLGRFTLDWEDYFYSLSAISGETLLFSSLDLLFSSKKYSFLGLPLFGDSAYFLEPLLFSNSVSFTNELLTGSTLYYGGFLLIALMLPLSYSLFKSDSRLIRLFFKIPRSALVGRE